MQAVNLDAEPDKYSTLLCFRNQTDLTLFGNRRFPSYQVIELEVTLIKAHQPSAQVLPRLAIVLPDNTVDLDLRGKTPYYTDYKVVWEGILTLQSQKALRQTLKLNQIQLEDTIWPALSKVNTDTLQLGSTIVTENRGQGFKMTLELDNYYFITNRSSFKLFTMLSYIGGFIFILTLLVNWFI